MNFGGQIFVMRFDGDGHQRCVSVDGFQFDFIHIIAKRVSFGRGNLHQLVLTQRQLLRPICARSAGRDGVHPFIFLIPDCSITADDFFRGAYFKNSIRKAAFFKDRRLIFKAHFGFTFKADELQALLFKADLSHDGFIGNLDVQLVHLVGGIARLANEHGQTFRPNQVSFRRRDFLNRV